MDELGRAHAGLPDDLMNFHYDPVACAVALGWSGAVVAEMRLRPVLEEEVLRFQPDRHGRPLSVVVDLDGASFAATWLSAVEAAQRRPEGRRWNRCPTRSSDPRRRRERLGGRGTESGQRAPR